MDIELKKITIRELTEQYQDNEHDGIFGYNNRLDIRPPYQREFVYDEKQRDAVINTVNNDFPLNVMYWALRSDNKFEIIDGQQRTISICQYINGDFSFENKYFHNLRENEKEKFLKYELTVYICSGTESEKLEWFKIINIAGEKLEEQELRNAVYSGSWVTDAKRYFSKNGCPAYNVGGSYLNGDPIRQKYLETTIKWISNNSIEEYMAEHQHNPNANELWLYFQSVINWTKIVFPKYRKEMKGVDWGFLYNQFSKQNFDSSQLEVKIKDLMKNEDVTKKSGIYFYLLTNKEKYLNIRTFSDNQKREAYERQDGICNKCGIHFELEEMEADHITPWHLGGKTSDENCQMLCKEDNRKKSGK